MLTSRKERALSMVEARDQLTRLPEEFDQMVRNRDGTPVVKVTRRNRPVLAILSWELYESIVETLEVLGDDEQMVVLRQAIQEVAQGQGKPWNVVKEELGWNEPGSFQSAANRTT